MARRCLFDDPCGGAVNESACHRPQRRTIQQAAM
jgi:hypothetical protein